MFLDIIYDRRLNIEKGKNNGSRKKSNTGNNRKD